MRSVECEACTWNKNVQDSRCFVLLCMKISTWNRCVCTPISFTSKSNAPLLCCIIDEIDDEKGDPRALSTASVRRVFYDFSWCMCFFPFFDHQCSILEHGTVYYTIYLLACSLDEHIKNTNFDVNYTIFSQSSRTFSDWVENLVFYLLWRSFKKAT